MILKWLALIAVILLGTIYSALLNYSPASSVQQQTKTAKQFASIILASLNKDLEMRAEDAKLIINREELEHWTEKYIRSYSGLEDLRISHQKVSDYLESLAPRLNIEPINAKLKFSDGRADIFVPSVNGRKLKITESADNIIEALTNNNEVPELLFETTEPEITLNKINNLGIETLIGSGESDYGNSSRARISNIKTGLAKFNGIILKPGEEFSFNKILGEVDEKNGYLAELVIKNGKLVREYGGGLCQVATTVFRAAILSGLEIVERKPHSFPVRYYDPQGFDATIYPGIVDLKFTNNTTAHVLIQTKLVGSKLLIEIYGPKKDNEVVIEGPVQYDKKSNGAMKAYFVRKIYDKENLIKEERFNSSYSPPPPSPLERNPLE